mgnify:CR=1 FL=1
MVTTVPPVSRDVISREMFQVCADPACDGQIWLDLTELDEEIFSHKLSDLRKEVIHYLGIDPVSDPIPVSPGIHFFMGGLLVDEGHRTNIEGLYAAGECACQYHGANRLGANSMLAAIYGGRVAAESAAKERELFGDQAGVEKEFLQKENSAFTRRQTDGKTERTEISPDFSGRLSEILWSGLGIVRDKASLEQALTSLEELGQEKMPEVERRLMLLGKAMLLSALSRKESRGAHTRRDYPERDDLRYRKITVASLKDGKVEIAFKELPEEREKINKPRAGKITVSVNQSDSRVLISVKDDGRGIDIKKVQAKAIKEKIIDKSYVNKLSKHDFLNMIFRPGFSTEDKITEISGRGMGLDIVNNKVTSLNGKIQIITEKGFGTEIILDLPVENNVITNKEINKKPIINNKNNKTIFVVDDSRATRMHFSKILEDCGFSCLTFEYAEDAIKKLKNIDCDLIISDIEMPKMNGYDFIGKIRKDKKLKDIPVIVISMLTEKQVTGKFKKTPISAFINKSDFNKENLLNIINKLI